MMELGQLLLEALNLMFIGMLFVGLFLGILVFLIPLLNKIVPDDKPESPSLSPSIQLPNHSDDDTLIAVISAAVQKYRNQYK